MARKKDRYAHLAASKIEARGQVVHIRKSAVNAGADAGCLRQSIESFCCDWIVEDDERIRSSQFAALKHKGLIL